MSGIPIEVALGFEPRCFELKAYFFHALKDGASQCIGVIILHSTGQRVEKCWARVTEPFKPAENLCFQSVTDQSEHEIIVDPIKGHEELF